MVDKTVCIGRWLENCKESEHFEKEKELEE
jgi:hypothetical protein